MKLKYYEIDEEKLLQEARKGKRIAIKMPEGLQPYGYEILQFLKENNIDAIFLADSCYGACDFRKIESIDRVICIGEAEMPYLRRKYLPPVSFIEAFYEFNADFIGNALPYLEGNKIGLVSITPFIHRLEECKEYLEKRGYEVFIGRKSRRTKYDGQILGCDFTPAMQITRHIDSFLFIGDGLFHPVGLYIATKKPVVAANPVSKEILREEITNAAAKIIKQRYAAMAKAIEAEKYGIIVTDKIGQLRLQLARKILELIEKKGKKGCIIMMDNIDEKVNYLGFDCYVSTACPRVAIDDAAKFEKPVLTPVELDIVLNEREWENYEFDQIL
jgi:2-(3-amino-3-carboxypropyl)histidine synthase